MTCFGNLYHEFRHLEGQPVKIMMNDHNTFYGLVLTACECSCRIMNRCGDIMLIEYAHIDAVEEPQMRLLCHCEGCGCGGRKREEFDFDGVDFSREGCRDGCHDGGEEGRRD